MLLIGRQGATQTPPPTPGSSVAGRHCPKAGGLRARRPFGMDLFKKRRLVAQSKVPASVCSGSRMKDGRDRDPSFYSDLSPH